MKKELIFINLCSISLVLMTFATISNSAITIVENNPSTKFETIPFEKLEAKIGVDKNALTKWKFKLKNKIKGSTKLDSIENGVYSINFKISSITVETSLLIDVFLPNNADEKLESHEHGHVRICKKIYRKSLEKLPKLLTELLGQNFKTEGSSFKEAQAKALQASNVWLVNEYNKLSNEKTASISKIYDELSKNSNTSSDKLVDQAINCSR